LVGAEVKPGPTPEPEPANRRESTDRKAAPGGEIELPGTSRVPGPLRATLILTAFMGLTLPLMPVQYLLLRMAPKGARRLPYWYHRAVCRLLGIRLHVHGRVAEGRPVLIVANHVSWLDIPVLSAVAPLSFIAKREVGTWPFVSSLARLQRTVFVDRARRTAVDQVADEMAGRLEAGDTLVLFAEGTSTDGNRVGPFKSALFSAVFKEAGSDVSVQTLALTYTHLHGIPLGRADRHMIGWYGDMEMGDHAWALLKSGPLDVHISIGEPVPLTDFASRKELASHTEEAVRAEVVALLRGGGKSGSRPGS
jgi:1-acyl-sn-glycerol-3-phosphate acyltransferase